MLHRDAAGSTVEAVLPLVVEAVALDDDHPAVIAVVLLRQLFHMSFPVGQSHQHLVVVSLLLCPEIGQEYGPEIEFHHCGTVDILEETRMS